MTDPSKSEKLGDPPARQPPTIDELKRLLPAVCRKHGIVGVQLYGSVARGDAKAGSDVDLIIEFDRNRPSLGFFEYFDLQEDLAKATGTPVDVMTTEDYQRIGNPYLLISISDDKMTLLTKEEIDQG